MRNQQWRSDRVLVVAWLLIAICLSLAGSWLFERSFMLTLISAPVLLFAGFMLVIYLILRARWRSLLMLIGGGFFVAVSPLGDVGHHAWSWISLRQHQRSYEAIIADADTLPPSGELFGESYLIETVSPTRVIFPRSQGMPDGWSAFVYDPGGLVDASGRKLAFRSGAVAQSCIHVSGPWRRCWFD